MARRSGWTAASCGTFTRVKIFTDAGFTGLALDLLQKGIGQAELVQSAYRMSVVLQAKVDPAMDGAEIALGQPPAQSVLEAKELKWLEITSAGYTRYDTPEFWSAAKARGLIVTNSSSVYDEPCAEQALAFLLAQARQLPASLRSRVVPGSDEWYALRHTYKLLPGQRMVILGYGAIAERLVALLKPFKMVIHGWRRRPRGDEAVPMLSDSALPGALGEADHVMNILPDNAQTRGFFDAARFEQIKAGAIFYNIGRGTTVDQKALHGALMSGRVGAAWLDVTEPEPLPEDDPLRQLANCHIVPHIAGGHHNENVTIVRHFLDNLRRFRDGQPLENRIL